MTLEPIGGELVVDHRGVDDWVPMIESVGDLAARIAATSFVPKGLRGKVPEVAAAILTGRELGLPPMKSLAEIFVVDGRPSLSANGMRALVLAAGHRIVVEHWSDQKCTISGWRRGDPDPSATVTYTIGDAQRAGLANRGPWKAHPRAMLLARATSELCRAVFADTVGGLPLADDIADDTAQPRNTVRRRAAQSDPEPSHEPTPTQPTPEPSSAADDAPGPRETASQNGGTDEPGITSRQMRQIQALLKDRGITDPQTQRDGMAAVIGRPIASRKELTKTEASQIIDQLISSR